MRPEDFQIERSRAVTPWLYRAPEPGVDPYWLKEYQHAGVEFAISRDNAIIGDAPGVGKTPQGIALSNAIEANRTLVIPPASLRLNWEREIWRWSTVPNVTTYPVLKASDGISSTANYVIVSYDLLRNQAIFDAICDLRWDHLILDECFPAGTAVATEDGSLDIAMLVNERRPVRVWAAGPRGLRLQPVTRYVRTPAPLKAIEIAAGEHYVTCTPNHRVWTMERGYVRAEELREGETLRVCSSLESEPSGSRSRTEPVEPRAGARRGERESAAESSGQPCGRLADGASGRLRGVQNQADRSRQPFLRPQMLGGMAVQQLPRADGEKGVEDAGGKEAAPIRSGASEVIGPHDALKFRSGVSRRSGCYIEVAERPDLVGATRRQRKHNVTSDCPLECATLADGAPGVRYFDGGSRGRQSTAVLQSGFGGPGDQDGDRDRWCEPPNKEMAFLRPAQDRGSSFARVDRVSVLERRSPGRPEGGSGESDWVYNIEVAIDHNYFANGIQVSNCHALKDPKGNKRTHAICAEDGVRSVCGRITMLSGTLLPNQPIECYNAIRLCDWAAIDSASLEEFREEYYEFGGGMVRSPVQMFDKATGQTFTVSKLHWSDRVRNVPRKLDQLQRILRSRLMVRRLKEQVLHELPPKQWHLFPIAIDAGIRKAMRHPGWSAVEHLYELDPDAFEVSIPIDGAISTARRELGEASAPAVASFIDDLIESGVRKVIVGAWHTTVLGYLRERLGRYGLVYMDGSTPMGKRQRVVDDFQEKDEIVVILGQTKVLGEGWPLTAAQDVVNAEPDWVPGNNEQLADRPHRLGQTGSVICHMPVVAGTVAERILGTAVAKSQNIYDTLDRQ